MAKHLPPERIIMDGTMFTNPVRDEDQFEYILVSVVEERERVLREQLESYLGNESIDSCCQATVRDILRFMATLDVTEEKR